ncbi:UNVERIFIED_CONTAM: hypothetical protein FKN15_007111 [Acipenser sinensis]
MVCGGFTCSKNALSSLNVVYMARHAANPELQRRRTTQLWAAYRQARRRLASLQGSLVRSEPRTPWLN